MRLVKLGSGFVFGKTNNVIAKSKGKFSDRSVDCYDQTLAGLRELQEGVRPVVYELGQTEAYPGKYVQVIDNETNTIVIQGTINDMKEVYNDGIGNDLGFSDQERLYSVGGKYFFKLDSHKYTVKNLPIYFVNEGFISKKYKLQGWMNYDHSQRGNFDIYIEHNIDELDEEVENIVYTLNRFSKYLKTTGSCSGHNKGKAWVELQFDNSRTLEEFVNIFEPFKCKMDFTTSERSAVNVDTFNGNSFFPAHSVMCLITKQVGSPAYDTLDEFAEYLKKIISVRNDSFNQIGDIIRQESEHQG